MKILIVHTTTAKITVIKRYIHIWHVCLIMTNFLVGIFGDSTQLTNWILDSGAMCHMTPEVLEFLPGSLEDMDNHIEVTDGHHNTAEKNDKYK